MRPTSFARGYSLVELMITIAVLGMLLVAVGTAVTHVLDAEMLGAGRESVLRTADQLASRMTEEARSSTAVFVPKTDVFGQTNAGREVDFFRKPSGGGSAFVAYHFDAASGTVNRYEYVPAAGGNQILNSDLMAEHIVGFSAQRTTPAAIGGIVGGSGVAPVNLYYGTPELVGGNGIVTVSMSASSGNGPAHQVEVHLSSRAAPTDLAILVPTGTPPPTPGPTPTTVAFLLVHPPHGSNHSGNPGGGELHGPGIPGTAEFFGNGGGDTESWFELTSQYGTIQDGTYVYHNSSGVAVSVSVSCGGSVCPIFVPMPIPTSGSTIVFHTAQ